MDIPDTYGQIIGVKTTHTDKTIRPERVYKKGGVVIRFMEPLCTYSKRTLLEESIYPFEHHAFGKAFHVIDPEEEITRLKKKQAYIELSKQEKIKKVIQYLNQFIQ